MAVKDTHKAFERLTGAGYSKEMTEALLEILGESWDDLVTRTDIADMATRADLRELESRLELRLTLRFGVMLAAATSLMIAVLLVLELLSPS
ncbi:MAG: hypothetical protein F4X83_12090 [Chloroflexi bacterium]|nr:hypothetical protein [Chloroflexota bacterium]